MEIFMEKLVSDIVKLKNKNKKNFMNIIDLYK